MARRKPTVTGASMPRKKAMAIKGDTGLYDVVNVGEQKASIIEGIRVIEDNMERKDGGKKVITAQGRYRRPPESKAPGVRESVDRRRAGEHYDPFFRNRVNDFVEDMVSHISEQFEDET